MSFATIILCDLSNATKRISIINIAYEYSHVKEP